MSQLEIILSWTQDDCQQKIGVAVPLLINNIQDTESLKNQLEAMKLLSCSFIQLIQLKELERQVYSKITNQILGLFNAIEEEIKSMCRQLPGASTELLVSHLEDLMTILDCTDRGLRRYLIGSDGEVTVEMIHSLQSLTLQLLHASFTHCLVGAAGILTWDTESNDIYGDLVNTMSDSLTQFFQKVYTLQTTFLSLVDKMAAEDISEEEVDDLIQVCDSLYRLSKSVVSLDVKIAVSLWKSISRLLTRYKSVLRTEVDTGDMVKYLCDQIKPAFSHIILLLKRGAGTSQGEDKTTYNKPLRLVGFQMKLVIMLVKEYLEQLEGHEKDVYQLLIHLYKLSPPNLCASTITTHQHSLLQTHILNASHPLLSYLANCPRFISTCLLNQPDISDDAHLAHLLIIINILSVLPKMTDVTYDQWLSPVVSHDHGPSQDVISALFQAIDKCHVEMSSDCSLPGVMSSGQPQRNISLYEYTCTHTGGFLGSLPARHFPQVESCLLRNLLSPNPYITTLAADTTCFIARYGSSELCSALTDNMCRVVRELAVVTCSRQQVTVTVLVRRLVKFLSAHHQKQLLTKYPVQTSLWLWSILDWSTLTTAVAQAALDAAVNCCCGGLQKFLSNPGTSQLNTVVERVKCLSAIYHIQPMSPTHRATVPSLVAHTWAWLDRCFASPLPVCQIHELTLHLVRLTVSCIPYFTPTHVTAVLVSVDQLVTRGCGATARLCVAHVLTPMLSSLYPPDPQSQASIHASLERICETLVADDCEPVHSTATDHIRAYLDMNLPHTQLQTRLRHNPVIHVRLDSPSPKESTSITHHLRQQAGLMGWRSEGVADVTLFFGLTMHTPVHHSGRDPQEQWTDLLDTMGKCRQLVDKHVSDLPLSVKTAVKTSAQGIVRMLQDAGVTL